MYVWMYVAGPFLLIVLGVVALFAAVVGAFQ
jgi:hypothetical protein